jgi:hypothetical protein
MKELIVLKGLSRPGDRGTGAPLSQCKLSCEVRLLACRSMKPHGISKPSSRFGNALNLIVLRGTKTCYGLGMMEVLLVLLSIFGAGFGVGYGVREIISRRRRRRSYLLSSRS